MPDANASYNSGSWHRTQVNQETGIIYCRYQYNGSYTLNGTAGYLCIAKKANSTNNFLIAQIKF